MMASILVEAWDLYSIAFVLIFIKEQYNPDPLMLGLAAAGTQGGALIGALLGGWLSDKIGRRVMFLVTMVLFIVLALAQAFVPNVTWLIVIRFLLGIPLGSDISTGYTYIMESMAKGEREVMGNRWQFMFAVGEVLTGVVDDTVRPEGTNHLHLRRGAHGGYLGTEHLDELDREGPDSARRTGDQHPFVSQRKFHNVITAPDCHGRSCLSMVSTRGINWTSCPNMSNTIVPGRKVVSMKMHLPNGTSNAPYETRR